MVDPFYTPNMRPRPLSVGQSGEKLFEFLVGHDRYLFELRDHGEALGVECQIFKNEELLLARRFYPRLDASRPSRELAIVWAREERKAIGDEGTKYGGVGRDWIRERAGDHDLVVAVAFDSLGHPPWVLQLVLRRLLRLDAQIRSPHHDRHPSTRATLEEKSAMSIIVRPIRAW